MEGPLAERLDAINAGREFAPTFVAAIDRLVANLTHVSAGENAPRVGERMPPFQLPGDDGSSLAWKRCLKSRRWR